MLHFVSAFNIKSNFFSIKNSFWFYLGVGFVTFVLFFPIDNGVDYFWTFRPYTLLWLQGKTSRYNELTTNLYNPPWLIWLLVPLASLPFNFGLALLRTLTVIVVIYGLVHITHAKIGYGRLLAIVLGIVNLHNFDLIYRGQLDGFVLLGALLALQARHSWQLGIAYTLLSIKPPNSLPLICYFLVHNWQVNGFRKTVKSLIIPILVLLISFGLHGWWPLRWLKSYNSNAPMDVWRSTIWRAADVLSLSPIVPALLALTTIVTAVWLWHYATTTTTQLVLILVTTFVITPYALSYHYVLLLVLVFPLLTCWKLWLGIVLYLLTYLPLVRVLFNPSVAYIDVLFAIVTFVGFGGWLIFNQPSVKEK